MKFCAVCRRTYTDESLNYCLEDGTPLQRLENHNTGDSSSETVVMPGTVPTNPNQPLGTRPPGVYGIESRPRRGRGWLWALIVLVIVVPLCGGGVFVLRAIFVQREIAKNIFNAAPRNTNIQQHESSPTPEATPEVSPTASPGKGLTLEKYKQLKDGMTLSEVERILGGPGTELSSSTGGGTTYSVYQWEDEDFTSIIITFSNDKVMSRTQVGLK